MSEPIQRYHVSGVQKYSKGVMVKYDDHLADKAKAVKAARAEEREACAVQAENRAFCLRAQSPGAIYDEAQSAYDIQASRCDALAIEIRSRKA